MAKQDNSNAPTVVQHLGTVTPAVSGLPVGSVIGGRRDYRLECVLGVGGFGVVYRARALDDGEVVALKLLSLPNHQHMAEGIRRELSALRAIDDHRIPLALDWNLDPERPFVVMPYYQHGNICEYLRDRPALAEHHVWDLLEDLLGALVSAHSASILHLDIKPDNVLVDSNERFVLTDFGISQAHRARTRDYRLLPTGTRGYQAPEQRTGRYTALDIRTDLYSVGATVWSLYTSINLANIGNQQLFIGGAGHDGLPLASEYRGLTSIALDSMLQALTKARPEDRPGSAAEALVLMETLRSSQAEHQNMLPGMRLAADEVEEVIDGLVDPLLTQIVTGEYELRRLHDGEQLCVEGERSFRIFVLLAGKVDVQIGGVCIATETREGQFLGEVSALTGQFRTAGLVARGEVVVQVLGLSDLETIVVNSPGFAIRMIRSMAARLARGASR